MNYEKEICDTVDRAFDPEQIEWFKALVEQPSYSTARDDVEQAAKMIDSRAALIGLRRTLVPDETENFADHRVYSTPATLNSDRAMLLVGHCDTVFPRSRGFLEFQRDPPNSESRGDTIRGPGVLDMKSGLSVIIFALQAIARTAPKVMEQLKLRFICNTDEEVGSPSSRALFAQIAEKTSSAMVFEGGRDGDKIITSRKGTGGFRLTAHGREAHAGNDHANGANAIHALALIVPKIQSLTDYQLGTTLNVGLIEGGTAKNTVPGFATATVDLRVATAEQARLVEQQLAELVEHPFRDMHNVPECPDCLEDVRFELQGEILRQPMEPTKVTQELRLEYEGFAIQQGLGIGEAPTQGGGSDANLLAAHGVPTIDGLGPYGKHFHSTQEWCSLESLRKRTKALACFLRSHVTGENY